MKTFGSHENCRLGPTLVLRFLPLAFDLAIADVRTRRRFRASTVSLFLALPTDGGHKNASLCMKKSCVCSHSDRLDHTGTSRGCVP